MKYKAGDVVQNIYNGKLVTFKILETNRGHYKVLAPDRGVENILQYYIEECCYPAKFTNTPLYKKLEGLE